MTADVRAGGRAASEITGADRRHMSVDHEMTHSAGSFGFTRGGVRAAVRWEASRSWLRLRMGGSAATQEVNG